MRFGVEFGSLTFDLHCYDEFFPLHLRDFRSDRNAHIATMLNLSDGLLGEYLQLQILLTVNCSLDEIDPALRRRGRLMAYRKFDVLSPQRAREIAMAHGIELPDSEQPSWTLAECLPHPRPLPRRREVADFGEKPF